MKRTAILAMVLLFVEMVAYRNVQRYIGPTWTFTVVIDGQPTDLFCTIDVPRDGCVSQWSEHVNEGQRLSVRIKK